MTTLVTGIGMIFGVTPVSGGTGTTSISIPFVASTSTINYLRGTNGTNTFPGSSRPYVPTIVANTSFTVSNLGAGAINASWMCMP